MFKNKVFCILTYEDFKGSGQELRDYLVKKGSEVYFIANVFYFSKAKHISYLLHFKNNKLVKKYESIEFPKLEFLQPVKDLLYTIYLLTKIRRRVDYFVGCGAVNVIPGIILQKLKLVDKTIFFTIDYVMEGRFKYRFLNKIYVVVDRLAFFNSDYTFNVSDRMASQRIIEIGDKAKKKNQITVPIGVMLDAREIKVKKIKNSLVYSGSILKGFGLPLIIKSLNLVKNKIPDVHLRIIGGGEYFDEIKKLVKQLNLEKNVEFVGQMNTIKDRELWLKRIKECQVGLALYDSESLSYKKYSDVTKPKDYMSCGLPVIVTTNIAISEDVSKYNLGRAVDEDVDLISNAIIELLSNPKEMEKIAKNVNDYILKLTWDNIFDNAFNTIKKLES